MTQQGLVDRESRGTSVYYRIADESVYALCDLVCHCSRTGASQGPAVGPVARVEPQSGHATGSEDGRAVGQHGGIEAAVSRLVDPRTDHPAVAPHLLTPGEEKLEVLTPVISDSRGAAAAV